RRHIQHRKVVVHERPRETPESDRDECELTLSGRPRQGHPRRDTPRRADDRQHTLRERQQQREYQCKLSDFRDHKAFFLAPGRASTAKRAPSSRCRILCCCYTIQIADYLAITLFCAFCVCSIARAASGGM